MGSTKQHDDPGEIPSEDVLSVSAGYEALRSGHAVEVLGADVVLTDHDVGEPMPNRDDLVEYLRGLDVDPADADAAVADSDEVVVVAERGAAEEHHVEADEVADADPGEIPLEDVLEAPAD